MKIVIEKTNLRDLIVLRSELYDDDRGSFEEVYNVQDFKSDRLPTNFVQDSISRSKKNVIRGLHIQEGVDKLVSVIYGKILDVAVDVRPGSPTVGQYYSKVLDGNKSEFVWIPDGFAHGFLVLSSKAIVSYKQDIVYNPDHISTIAWNDPYIGIDWPIEASDAIVSQKDRNGEDFQTYMFKKGVHVPNLVEVG
jgi:dTDP-4-dehydrorhamnose 3,5-epimerase